MVFMKIELDKVALEGIPALGCGQLSNQNTDPSLMPWLEHIFVVLTGNKGLVVVGSLQFQELKEISYVVIVVGFIIFVENVVKRN